MSTPFVHLRVHTEYSLSDSVVRIPELMTRTADLGMPAVALTDAGNLFALVKFYRAAEARGLKPILGIDLELVLDGEEQAGSVTVLVCGRHGYRALSRAVSRSYTEGQRAGGPQVLARWLEEAPELIALAGRASPVGRALAAGGTERAGERLDALRDVFRHGLYLELTRTGRPQEEAFNRAAVALAVERGVAVVATNDVRFITPEDFEAHEARVAIHRGYRLTETNRPNFYSREQYLKSPREMAERFEDLPEALAASVAIAERATFELDLGRAVLPAFPVSAGEDESSQLRRAAADGLQARLSAPGFRPAAEDRAYRDRLAEELGVVVKMGFAGYFLIVADFIDWARGHGVPVGPGRGSGAGSLVAYALGITDLDPLAYDLLFERFLNPERVSMPDFDIDFCIEGRDRVIDYVAERYGRDRVSQIITYGSMAARAVVRDVGRVLGHPYGYVDKIAKLVPFEIGMTLERALRESGELKAQYDGDEEVRSLLDLAGKLEGLARNAGKHAGGVVIAPAPLTEFTPLYAESNGASPVTQLDKDDVEQIGLVKFDFLGLRTLTIIARAEELINAGRAARGEGPVSVRELALDDRDTFGLLKTGNTTAVFQLESRGMKELIGQLQPDRFEDIIALVALFRPGPLQSGMVEDFVARKHGRADVHYPHPALKTILEPTYGVILYQEQVMQIARELAGYTLGGADLLRRAMGKKKAEEMARQREVFLSGAQARGVEGRVASHIFDLMEKFAGYGFNKSHSAAYALLSYQTAWLKAHYPAAYMAAVLSSDMDHSDKIVRIIDECRRMELEILPPDVNRSGYAFAVEGSASIRYGLGAIKGLGRGAAEAIVNERESAGPYSDLADLCLRGDPSRLNRRAFEALIEAGAADALGAERAALMAELPRALAAADQRQRAGAAGQVDLFGVAAGEAPPAAAVQAWDEKERLRREKRTLGLYLSGHPVRRYLEFLPRLGAERISELVGEDPSAGMPTRPVRIAGLIVELRRFGRRTAVTLDDASGRIEAVFFDDGAERARRLLVPDAVVVLDGRLAYDDYFKRWRITAGDVTDIDEILARQSGSVWIDWIPDGGSARDFVARLKTALSTYVGGEAFVGVRYRGGGASACLRLGQEWRVAPSPELIEHLQTLTGVARVEVTYRGDRAGNNVQ